MWLMLQPERAVARPGTCNRPDPWASRGPARVQRRFDLDPPAQGRRGRARWKPTGAAHSRGYPLRGNRPTVSRPNSSASPRCGGERRCGVQNPPVGTDWGYQQQAHRPTAGWPAGTAPVWGAAPTTPVKRDNPLGALFDFSFTQYATPALVKIVYVLTVVAGLGSWLLSVPGALRSRRCGRSAAVTRLAGRRPAVRVDSRGAVHRDGAVRCWSSTWRPCAQTRGLSRF